MIWMCRILITGVRASGKTVFVQTQLERHRRAGTDINELEDHKTYECGRAVWLNGFGKGIEYMVVQDASLLPAHERGDFDMYLVCHHEGNRYWVEVLTETMRCLTRRRILLGVTP